MVGVVKYNYELFCIYKCKVGVKIYLYVFVYMWFGYVDYKYGILNWI